MNIHYGNPAAIIESAYKTFQILCTRNCAHSPVVDHLFFFFFLSLTDANWALPLALAISLPIPTRIVLDGEELVRSSVPDKAGSGKSKLAAIESLNRGLEGLAG